MKKEDFKIEIIEQTYANGDKKFVPTVFMLNQNYKKMSKFDIFCNHFRFDSDWLFKIDEYNELQIFGTKDSVTLIRHDKPFDSSYLKTKDDAIAIANLAINTYLKQIDSTIVIETKIHKIT